MLIAMLGPISGAHFNPAVTAVFLLQKKILPGEAGAFAALCVCRALVGTDPELMPPAE